ncbi:hypothetical protein Q8A73_018451 [Channa argus]|nr:hypothetical protein Q8A73_018451 [Channa argus]
MPLFINRDQIFAHQVHLLEHKLRSKEERLLELETENAILHLRLAECLGKLHVGHEKNTKALDHHQHQRNSENITQSVLTKLLSEVQALKQDLSEVFAIYVNFANELEVQSKQLLKKVEEANSALKDYKGDEVQDLQARVEALERTLEEEKERCRAERQRRKELHNILVVRTDIIGRHHQKKWSMQSAMVHGPDDTQDAVFEDVKPLLTSLLDGYNVCIMAYGQTGSGKTHTMIGSQPLEEHSATMQEAQQGIIPKAAAELFRLISEQPAESHTVDVSVMEVYNNEVFDLLARDEQGNAVSKHRDVISTSSGTSQVTSLTSEPVFSASEVMHIVSGVLKLRAHRNTLIHTDSSRSHLIVTLTLSSKSPNALALARRLQSAKKDMQRCSQRAWWSPRCHRANPAAQNSPDKLFRSPSTSPRLSPSHSPCPSPRQTISPTPFRTKLQLVDLAGSECVGVSGVSGAALWEVSCINRSLSALSDVLGALAEHRPHVPYRNSKLTHLLQDAIGGDAKLLVMLCVSPTQRFITESLQSLGFGTRARQVHKLPPHRRNNTLKDK